MSGLRLEYDGKLIEWPDIVPVISPEKQWLRLDAHLVNVGDILTIDKHRFRVVSVSWAPAPCGEVEVELDTSRGQIRGKTAPSDPDLSTE